MMRGARKNLSWLVLGKRMNRLDQLHPLLRRKAEAARRRGLQWQAYAMIEEDKSGGRRPAGQWLWIPKAGIVGHLELPSFGTFVGGAKHAIQWSRTHPLARNLKEVWYHHQWGAEEYERAMRKKDPEYIPGQPRYKHWLEAREVAEREGRRIAPFDEWQKEVGEPWHEEGVRSFRRKMQAKWPGKAWNNPNARRFAARLGASLRRLRAYLKGLVSKARGGGFFGWDTILDRTEAAIMRCCPGLFRTELRAIESLHRRYEGYKMPTVTAIGPANTAIVKAERALGIRPARGVRRRRR